MKLLIVEDDAKIASYLQLGLAENHYASEIAADGVEALYMLDEEEYDLMILDLNLPKLNGIELLTKIRQNGNSLPVIILSACALLDERIRGLEHGADDYLTKPFSFAELLLRLRALLRRRENYLPELIEINDLVINLHSREVFKQKKFIKLTAKEYSLLIELAMHRNKLMTRANLLARIWGFSFDNNSNVIDVTISRLRKKLSLQDGELIHSIHGSGYVLI